MSISSISSDSSSSSNSISRTHNPPPRRAAAAKGHAKGTAPAVIKGIQHTASSPKKRFVRNLTKDVNAKIKELSAENKKIMPKQINLTKLGVIQIASLVAIVAGAIFAMVGAALLITGAGLPVGLGLLAAGGALAGLGIAACHFTNKHTVTIKKVHANNAAIKQMQELIDPTGSGKANPYAQFAEELRQELKLTHMNLPTLVLTYPQIANLNRLHILAEKEAKNPPRDPRQPIFKDYSARLGFARSKVLFVNELLLKVNNKVYAIDQEISKPGNNQSQIGRLKNELKKELEKAKTYKAARTKIIKELPDMTNSSYKAIAMSYRAIAMRSRVKTLGRRLFSSIDGPGKKKPN
jgi:hypothetical protein